MTDTGPRTEVTATTDPPPESSWPPPTLTRKAEPMNETAFADKLVELVNAALHDGPEMLAQVATSFDEDTMIETIEQYTVLDFGQRLEFTTRRGDVFAVTVERIKAGGPTPAELADERIARYRRLVPPR